jgi:hypothetical protein
MVFIVLYALLFSACNYERKGNFDDNIYNIDFNNTSKVSSSNAFGVDNLTALQLDNSASTFLSGNFDIQFANNNYIVYDFTKNELLRFNEQGVFMNSIGRHGHSHEEFINVSSFLVDTKTHAIEVLCNNSKYIKKYSFEGEFIKAVEVPARSTGFAKDLNGEYWFYMVMIGDGELNYRLHHLSKEDEVKSYLPLKTHLMGVMEQNFYRTDWGLYFRESFFPSIYRLENESINPFIRIDFGENKITESDFENEKDPFGFFEKISQKGFYTTRRVIVGRDIVSILCQFQRDGHEIEQSEVIINTKTNKYQIVSYNDKLGDLLSNSTLIKIDNENGFHYITDPLSFKIFFKELFNDSANLINEDGNHVIFSLQLKNL